jgi:hypothetical protein
MNLEENKIYKIYYEKDSVNYFSFVKKQINGLLIDDITGTIFKPEQIKIISYQEINDNILYFLRKKYKKNKDRSLFIVNEEIETECLTSYIKLLRFFDLDYKEFTKDVNDKHILDKVINKCKKYVKRYVNETILNRYIIQLEKFKNISDIISFCPSEIYSIKKLFWTENFIGSYKYKIVLYNVPINRVEFFNELNLDWNLLFVNTDQNKHIREQYQDNFISLKASYLNQLGEEFKQKITFIINERLIDAKNTLQKEKVYAEETKDEDLLVEVQIIDKMILDLEKTVFNEIKELDIDIDLFNFWPELLYPVPDIVLKDFVFNEKTEILNDIMEWFKLYS